MRRRRIKITWREVLLDPIFISLLASAIFLLIFATSAVYLIEKGINPKITSYFDSLWWGLATITTVGYGDIVPITFAGRAIGMCLMATGPAIFVLFTGALWRSVLSEQLAKRNSAESHLESTQTKDLEKILNEINARLERLENK